MSDDARVRHNEEGGFTVKPYMPTAALAKIVGPGPFLGSSPVIAKVRAYVEQHGLIDPTDRSFIIADDALAEVYGARRIERREALERVMANLHVSDSAVDLVPR